MLSAIFAVAALASSAVAVPAMTAPVASTVWPAGQQQTIQWSDNGSPPTATDFGDCSVGIFVGGTTVEAEVQRIADNVAIATLTSIAFTPNPAVGPNLNEYFIRFTSNTCKDASGFPCEAFSAKFALSGMTGTFNSTIQSIADSASGTAPPVAAPSSSAGASVTPSSAASHSSSPSAASSGHSSSSSAKPTGASQNNAASGLFAGTSLVAVVASVLGAMML
ncbi:hypothetical protein BDW22DRAFT_1429257 [Trametopsis cervina]|nr:hypothetical protein BDW22DRAFT_1429257 [Trametopsis cervina]